MSTAEQILVSQCGLLYVYTGDFNFIFSVVHSLISSYADDFMQLFDLYSNDDGTVIPCTVGTLYHFDDFDIEEPGLQDFYFSVPYLIHYL